MNKERKVIDFAYLTMCAENDYIYETGEAKALLDYITNLQKENKELKQKISTYEDPEDLTLMFMYCDEKAKDKIKELHNKIDKSIEITHKILMNNADNKMICNEEEKEYFDWLDREMLEQEKILKDSDVDEYGRI